MKKRLGSLLLAVVINIDEDTVTERILKLLQGKEPERQG